MSSMYVFTPKCGIPINDKKKLSHIMGTAPILEMARAYGLLARLWLLVEIDDGRLKDNQK